jgi:hypothetical protein
MLAVVFFIANLFVFTTVHIAGQVDQVILGARSQIFSPCFIESMHGSVVMTRSGGAEHDPGEMGPARVVGLEHQRRALQRRCRRQHHQHRQQSHHQPGHQVRLHLQRFHSLPHHHVVRNFTSSCSLSLLFPPSRCSPTARSRLHRMPPVRTRQSKNIK